jgi:molybdenum cofactor biosynthesis protein B
VGVSDHKAKAASRLRCQVVTVSDTRDEASDSSGRLMCDELRGHGHEVCGYRILKDEPAEVARLVRELADTGAQVVLLNGGTGVSRRDTTVDAIAGLFEKRLDGFGELFRMLSYAEIGSAAMLSRAVAGVRGQTVVFAVPGSTAAVRLALGKLILPELGHVAAELAK